MKKIIIYLFLIFFNFSFHKAFSQEKEKISGTAVVGATTINGENYQQIGIRGDFPLGKFGFGLDLQLYIDADGEIRKEDWDEWIDYLDKIYYLRWGKKNDPFYIKIGGLDYTYLGYSNIVNGYSNMIEYPAEKRIGMETSFELNDFKTEIFLNDFKELFKKNPSVLIGTRVAYKILGDLEIGATVVTDLNEYNGLNDEDEDGFADDIDMFPNDKNLVTEIDEYRMKEVSNYTISELIEKDLLDSTEREDLFDMNKETSQSMVVSLDAGYPIFKNDKISIDIYTQISHILGHGWGLTFPGVRFGIGDFIKLRAEYRNQSKEFLYGYYDFTYELERAYFERQEDGSLIVKTKKESLEKIKNKMQGYFAGVNFNLLNFVIADISYQDLRGGNENIRSIKAELGLGKKIIPKISTAKAYYYQNNVKNFQELKTPSTMMGYIISYNLGGVDLGFDYRYTFQDKNGDGKISGKKETIKTVGIRAGVTF